MSEPFQPTGDLRELRFQDPEFFDKVIDGLRRQYGFDPAGETQWYQVFLSLVNKADECFKLGMSTDHPGTLQSALRRYEAAMEICKLYDHQELSAYVVPMAYVVPRIEEVRTRLATISEMDLYARMVRMGLGVPHPQAPSDDS